MDGYISHQKTNHIRFSQTLIIIILDITLSYLYDDQIMFDNISNIQITCVCLAADRTINNYEKGETDSIEMCCF